MLKFCHIRLSFFHDVQYKASFMNLDISRNCLPFCSYFGLHFGETWAAGDGHSPSVPHPWSVRRVQPVTVSRISLHLRLSTIRWVTLLNPGNSDKIKICMPCYDHEWNSLVFLTLLTYEHITNKDCILLKYISWRISDMNFVAASLTVVFILINWGRVMHISIGKLTIIGSDNGLALGRSQAIIWTSAWILLIGSLGTNFSEILIKIHAFSFIQENTLENVVWKMSAILSQPQWVKGTV